MPTKGKWLFLNLISTSKYVSSNCHNLSSLQLNSWAFGLVLSRKKDNFENAQ